MSANNQTLVIKGKENEKGHAIFYVFREVMAESWEEENCVYAKDTSFICNSMEDALKKAHQIDDFDKTEYGVSIGICKKDGRKIRIRE